VPRLHTTTLKYGVSMAERKKACTIPNRQSAIAVWNACFMRMNELCKRYDDIEDFDYDRKKNVIESIYHLVYMVCEIEAHYHVIGNKDEFERITHKYNKYYVAYSENRVLTKNEEWEEYQIPTTGHGHDSV
jgi:hypothetical protein